LSGCIPNLKLNGLSVKLNGPDFLQFKGGIRQDKDNENNIMQTGFTRSTYEVHTNGGNV
jgi:hypothetical protein